MSAAEEGGRNSKAGKAAGKGGDAGEKRAALKGWKGAGQKRKEASADTAHLEKQMKGRTLRVVDGGLEDLAGELTESLREEHGVYLRVCSGCFMQDTPSHRNGGFGPAASDSSGTDDEQ